MWSGAATLCGRGLQPYVEGLQPYMVGGCNPMWRGCNPERSGDASLKGRGAQPFVAGAAALCGEARPQPYLTRVVTRGVGSICTLSTCIEVRMHILHAQKCTHMHVYIAHAHTPNTCARARARSACPGRLWARRAKSTWASPSRGCSAAGRCASCSTSSVTVSSAFAATVRPTADCCPWCATRSCNPVCPGLQHYVPRAATLCAGGCNYLCRGMQPCVLITVTLCAQGCKPMCTGMQPCVSRDATLCAHDCNPVGSGLQPYVHRAATLCAQGCNPKCPGLQP